MPVECKQLGETVKNQFRSRIIMPSAIAKPWVEMLSQSKQKLKTNRLIHYFRYFLKYSLRCW